eukprot:CAMPEP_0194514252 /NCGR_PEP_ID=MMETSP0253-20130528/46647_1 /TAXON_ID=2966 /ORGANISM="Noctiluca scintillans" /LENGTH=392 /DNA_ID=CAMNT_0039357885 /DNA_START=40 /DNA_END=1214 /DNA_ORIENTATION=+
MNSLRSQCVIALLIAIGVDGLRMVESASPGEDIQMMLLDRQSGRGTLSGVPVEKTNDVGKSEPAVREWMFECANDCDQLPDRAHLLPEHCTLESVNEPVGFAVLKGPLTCASDVLQFFDTAGTIERTGRLSSVDKMLSNKSPSSPTPTSPTTPNPTTSPTTAPTTSPTPAPTTPPTPSATLEDSHAVGDPHIQSVIGRKFDLWRTGWSKFLQIPMRNSVAAPQLLVRGNVEEFTGGTCTPAYLKQVSVSGARLGNRSIFIQAGSLESTTPFGVQVDDGPLSPIAPSGTIFLSDAGVQVRGVISAPEPDVWGPDAQVFVSVGDVTVDVRQHTEGRFQQSKAMLDLSVQGLDGEVESVGGWLGTDDMSMSAGSPPEGCTESSMFFEIGRPEPHG